MSFFGKLFSGKDKENNESDYLDRAYGSLGDDADLNPDNILDRNAAATGSEDLYGEIYTAEGSDGDFGVELSADYDGGALTDAYGDDTEDITDERGEYAVIENDGAEYDIDAEYEETVPDEADEYDIDEIYGAAAEEEAHDEGMSVYDDGPADETEEYDADSAYAALSKLKGDTDEMDVDEIFRAMNEAGEYAELLKAESESDDVYTAETAAEYDAEDTEPYGTEYAAPEKSEADDGYDGSFGSLDSIGMYDDNSYHDPFSLQNAHNLISQDDLAASSLLNTDIDKETLYSAYAPKSMRPKITETSYYDLDEPVEEETPEQGAVKKFFTKKKKWIIGIAAAAAVIAVTVGALMFAQYKLDPLKGYTETYITKGNIIKTMEAGGSVEPNAR